MRTPRLLSENLCFRSNVRPGRGSHRHRDVDQACNKDGIRLRARDPEAGIGRLMLGITLLFAGGASFLVESRMLRVRPLAASVVA